MAVNSRAELAEYCLRRLGKGANRINVTDKQVDERIDDAIQFWHEYHHAGTERMYFAGQVTASTLLMDSATANSFIQNEKITGQTSGATATVWKIRDDNITIELRGTVGTFQPGEMVEGNQSFHSEEIATNGFTLGSWDRRYFELPDNIVSVEYLFNIGASSGTSPRNMFDVVYQFRLNDTYNLMSTDLVYYTMVKNHLSLIDTVFPSSRSIRFNRIKNRLYVDVNWLEVFTPGMFVVASCYAIIPESEFPRLYDDMLLKKYATALIKRQWGENLSKFDGQMLPGKVKTDGLRILNQALEEIEKIEDEIIYNFADLPAFFVG